MESFPRKIAAIGFIGLILTGNFALVYLVLDKAIPPILVEFLYLSVAVVFIGGILMLAFAAIALYIARRDGSDGSKYRAK